MATKEQILISSVINTEDIATAMAKNVDPLIEANKDIWLWIKNYYTRYRVTPGANQVQKEFPDFSVIETSTPVEWNIDELRKHVVKLKLEEALTTGASNITRSKEPNNVLNVLVKELSDITKISGQSRALDVTDVELAVDYYRNVRDAGGVTGIPTTFKAIDSEYPTGMAGGHYIVIIGYSGRGKTWFSGLLGIKAWEQGKTVLIISLEMTPEAYRTRMMTMLGEGKFNHGELTKGNTGDDYESWLTSRTDGKGKIIVASQERGARMTPNVIQGMIDQHHPDLVIVDYHSLMDDNAQSQGETIRMMNVGRELKDLATSNSIPVIDICAVTMNDSNDISLPPILEQVAWSKSIQYDADLAIAVHKEPDSNLLKAVHRKNRHGGEFAVYLDWDMSNGRITERFMEE